MAACAFRPHGEGKYLADLQLLARQRLARLGIAIHGNDGTDAWCTVSNPSRFFSHRRDRTSGRFAAAIWLA
jgi:polyphenol oxidase